MKFRKKPIVVEAMQFIAGDANKLAELLNFIAQTHDVKVLTAFPSAKLEITTLEGDMIATDGDWIIKGIQGEIYPCKADIFKKTYDPAYINPGQPILEQVGDPFIISECCAYCKNSIALISNGAGITSDMFPDKAFCSERCYKKYVTRDIKTRKEYYDSLNALLVAGCAECDTTTPKNKLFGAYVVDNKVYCSADCYDENLKKQSKDWVTNNIDEKVIPTHNEYNEELAKNGCSKCGGKYPKEPHNGAFKLKNDLSEIFCSAECADTFLKEEY